MAIVSTPPFYHSPGNLACRYVLEARLPYILSQRRAGHEKICVLTGRPRMLIRRAAWLCTSLARGFHHDRIWISVLCGRLRGSSLGGDEISIDLLAFCLQVVSIVHEEVRPVGARGVPVHEHSVRIPPHTLC